MTYVLAIVGYLIVYAAVALVSSRWSAAVGIGGLVSALMLARILT